MHTSRGPWLPIAVVVVIAASSLFAIRWLRTTRPVDAPQTSGQTQLLHQPVPLDALPGGALALVSIPDFVRFETQFRTTHLGRLIDDPEVRSKGAAAAQAARSHPGIAGALAALSAIDELRDLGVTSFALAVFPIANHKLGIGVAIETPAPARLATWLDSKLGIHGVTRSEDGAVTCFDYSLCRRILADAVWLSSPRAALDGLEAVLPGVRSGRVTAALANLDGDTRDLAAFVDLGAVAAILRERFTDGVDPAKAAEVRRVFDLLGVAGLHHLAYTQNVDSERFRGRLFLSYDSATSGTLGTMLHFPTRAAKLDQQLPAGYDFHSFGLLADPAATWDSALQFLRDLTPEADRRQMDQGLAIVTGLLGIDPREDIFAALGGEIGLSYSFDSQFMLASPESALGSARWVAAIGVVDAARLERLLGRLEPLASMQGLAMTSEPLADGKLWSLPIPIPGATAPPAVALAKGYLVLGHSASAVRDLVNGGVPTLAADAEFKELRQKFPSEGSWWGFSRHLGVSAATMAEYLHQAGSEPAGKPQETYRALSAIATPLEAFIAASKTSPRAADYAALRLALVPTWATELPLVDAWNHPFGFAGDDHGYALWSPGADGETERDWSTCVRDCTDQIRTTASENDDLVLARGQFIRWPADTTEAGDTPIPPELVEFATLLDARLSQLPPSMTFARSLPDGLLYEGLAPVDVMMSTVLGILGGGSPLARRAH